MVKPLDYLRAVLDDRKLSSSQRLVALAIMRHAGADGRSSHPGVKLLEGETGLSDKTIRQAAKVLVKDGWLILAYSGRGGACDKANEYDLSIPNGNGDRLEEVAQTVTVPVQTVTVSPSNGNGYRTDALGNAPRNASSSSDEPDGSPDDPDDDDGKTSSPPGESGSDVVSGADEAVQLVMELTGSFIPVNPEVLRRKMAGIAASTGASMDYVAEAINWWSTEGPGSTSRTPVSNPAGRLISSLPGIPAQYDEYLAAKKADQERHEAAATKQAAQEKADHEAEQEKFRIKAERAAQAAATKQAEAVEMADLTDEYRRYIDAFKAHPDVIADAAARAADRAAGGPSPKMRPRPTAITQAVRIEEWPDLDLGRLRSAVETMRQTLALAEVSA